jgi:hypothetical protein
MVKLIYIKVLEKLASRVGTRARTWGKTGRLARRNLEGRSRDLRPCDRDV